MASRSKRKWLDRNLDLYKRSARTRKCRICSNTVKQARILKQASICEFCARSLSSRREGKYACKGCGKIAPEQLSRHGGFCKECVCPACGRPDPQTVRRLGMCRQCASAVGGLCSRCGKEATAQVRRNAGVCDECAKKGWGTGHGDSK